MKHLINGPESLYFTDKNGIEVSCFVEYAINVRFQKGEYAINYQTSPEELKSRSLGYALEELKRRYKDLSESPGFDSVFSPGYFHDLDIREWLDQAQSAEMPSEDV